MTLTSGSKRRIPLVRMRSDACFVRHLGAPRRRMTTARRAAALLADVVVVVEWNSLMSLRPNGTWDVQVQQDRHLVRHDRNQRQCVQEVYGLLIVCNNFTIQAPGHRMAGSGCHKQGKSIAHGAKDTCLPITSLACSGRREWDAAVRFLPKSSAQEHIHRATYHHDRSDCEECVVLQHLQRAEGSSQIGSKEGSSHIWQRRIPGFLTHCHGLFLPPEAKKASHDLLSWFHFPRPCPPSTTFGDQRHSGACGLAPRRLRDFVGTLPHTYIVYALVSIAGPRRENLPRGAQ